MVASKLLKAFFIPFLTFFEVTSLISNVILLINPVIGGYLLHQILN